MKYSIFEDQTIITFDQEEDHALVFTFDKELMRQLDAQCAMSTMVTKMCEYKQSKVYRLGHAVLTISIPHDLCDVRHRKKQAATHTPPRSETGYGGSAERCAPFLRLIHLLRGFFGK